MPTNEVKAAVQMLHQAHAARFGLSKRPQQLAMMAAVTRDLFNESVGLIEAPTGVGKSLGYLVPGIALAYLNKRRVVVSTATIALQEQTRKTASEVAETASTLGWAVSVVVVRGRERYVCPLRLMELGSTDDLFEPGTSATHQLFREFSAGTWDGNKDTAPMGIEEAEWMRVSNKRHACLGNRCSMYSICPYYATMKAAELAHVVIANHDLVLNHLAHADNGPLVNMEKNHYVFDEGHHLQGKACQIFSSAVLLPVSWLKPLPSMLRWLSGDQTNSLKVHLKFAEMRLEAMRRALVNTVPLNEVNRLKKGILTSELVALGDGVVLSVSAVYDAVSEAIEGFGKARKSLSPLDERTLSDARNVLGKITDILDGLKDFFGDAVMARWIEHTTNGIVLNTSSFDPATKLKKQLWDVARGVVVTSATLAPMGRFDALSRELGIPIEKISSRRVLDSPLDYTRSRIVVIGMQSTPDQVDLHTGEVTQWIEWRLHQGLDGGAIVVFASRKQMEAVHSALSLEAQAMVLAQHQVPVHAMLISHQKRVESGLPSMLFGLATLSEGVDLPGRLCTLVVIPKLLFPALDDPVLATHAEHLEEKNLAPFPIIMLPRAWVRIRQTIGRLIRTETDWGEVVLLDTRVVTKRYGAQLLAGLPIKRVRRSFPAISGFLKVA